MLFTDKRKVLSKERGKRVSEYRGEDGIWYTVNDMYAMVPINDDGDMLARPSFYNRVNKGWERNPNLLKPKYTEAERASCGGGNNQSKLAKLSCASRAYKLRALKVGSFERGKQ
jgi:hypothetical protein